MQKTDRKSDINEPSIQGVPKRVKRTLIIQTLKISGQCKLITKNYYIKKNYPGVKFKKMHFLDFYMTSLSKFGQLKSF